MTDTEQSVELDRVHRVTRSGERWALQKRQPDGSYNMIEHWQGGRRSLFHHLERLRIVPTREAETIIATWPESTGFKER